MSVLANLAADLGQFFVAFFADIYVPTWRLHSIPTDSIRFRFILLRSVRLSAVLLEPANVSYLASSIVALSGHFSARFKRPTTTRSASLPEHITRYIMSADHKFHNIIYVECDLEATFPSIQTSLFSQLALK